MIHARYRAGAGSGRRLLSHQGEEVGLIIKGGLALEVDGRRYELEPGEVYRFNSRRPHRFSNAGDVTLEIVCVCTPQVF